MPTPTRIDSPSLASGSGTLDDEDNPNDERADENEAPVRDLDDRTETPEEFEVDDEDDANESGGALRADDELNVARTPVGGEWTEVDQEDVLDDEDIGDEVDDEQDE